MQTINEWEKLCRIFSTGFKTHTALEYMRNPTNSGVIIKHDIESDPQRALRIARVEHQYGIRATYYFQADIAFRHPAIVTTIASLGHEIGYHYDVMDANQGNVALAIDDFRSGLQIFADLGCGVATVCPHGNPMVNRNGWHSNKDFFRSPAVKAIFPEIIDIVVMAKQVFGERLGYISDVGYSWKLISAVDEDDRKQSNNTAIDDLRSFLLRTDCRPLVISSHPHRWQKNCIGCFFQELRFKAVRSGARSLAKIPFAYKILSRFYYVSRRF